VKTKAERSIEALTWAAVIIWLGFALVTHLLGYVWLIVMVLGIILLSSAIYQRSQGWQTSLALWVAGIWMAVFSVIEILGAFVSALNNGDGLNIDLWVYMGIALVSMGVAVVLRHVNFPKLSTSRQNQDVGTYGASSYIPRPVQEDYSAGYVAPAGQEDYSAGYAPAGGGGYSAPYSAQSQPVNPASAGYSAGYSGQVQPATQAGAAYNAGYSAQSQPVNPASAGYNAGYSAQSQPVNPAGPAYNAGYSGQSQPIDPASAGYAPAGSEGYAPGYSGQVQPPAQQVPPAQVPPVPQGYDPVWNNPAVAQPAARPGQRGSVARQRRTARPVEEPSDLESRVEDIIRRSREHRDVDNLPY